ncbi:mannitol dehydrogenase family protein [Enterocloster clostridioformis]|uniref:mannitol dehydrogenase family protein n=1 Tax=Enterocloster clostridioformis TaxID=1531 RepID=UPI00040595DC|nr:mannitol dehydrogenase family protein [Enterocloster clostridioformis]
MHLLDSELRNKEEWEAAGIELPKFDREAMKAATRECPQWVHFGAGNIFRAFPAARQQKLLNDGVEKTGIIVAEGYDYEIIKKAYRPQDDLSLLVTLKANGTIEKTVIGSLAESLTVDRQDEADWNRLKDIFASSTLQMVSFTITEKGYSITSADGSFRSDVAADFEAGPEQADSYIGKLAALCYWRYTHGAAPLALVSMDNCSHNGDKLYAAVDAYAKAWTENGRAVKGFLEYIENPAKVSFPWSMIDKITPRPDDSVKKMLEESGFTDTESIVTSKNTYVAPFVNAEEAEYLVIEDAFPNGRPQLEKAGVMFTTRDTVEKVERMKVCTCLNPLHTTLAVYGCLLGYTKISEEMKDADLVKLVEIIGYKEGLPVVTNPGILSPEKFIDEVLQIRVPNPFMPDTPQRIACDTSQKLSIRFGETIKEYMARPELDVKSLKFIPMVQAGWCRYLLGVDDEGNTFTVSPDPMYEGLAEKLQGVKVGEPCNVHEVLQPILSDAKIFGVDLYEAGLGEYVESIFAELIAGKGAVRAALQKHLAEA